MRKILITGGAGFMGSALAHTLVQDKDNKIVLVDNYLTGHEKNLPPEEHDNWEFIRCNVNEHRDIAEVMLSYQFDVVFHYAAMVGVQRTLQHPTLVLQDLDGIKNILNLAKNTGVNRIFYASSSEVYGETVEFPQHETETPLNSRLPYAVVKNAGEAFLRAYHQTYDLDYTIFRFFNTYGPHQTTDFVIPKFIELARQDQPIPIYGEGEQTRTFCHIDDTTEAVTTVFDQEEHVNDIVNIGNDQEVTIRKLAELVIELTDSKSEIQFLPPLEEGDMTRRQPDITKMKRLLNRSPRSLKEGLRDILSQRKEAPQSKTSN